MIKKATWICGLSLLLAGSVCAQYVSDVAAETTDAAIENQPGWVNPEVKDYEFNDQAGYEGTVRVGDWFSGATSTNNACLVIPFLLPDAGIISDPFTSADFSVFLQENNLFPGSAIDLYLVRTAPSNTVLSSDFYQGSTEANGTRIVTSFVSFASVGSNTISTTDAALLNALNTAYNGGAGAGEYVFFRLNYGLDTYAPQNDRCVIAVRGNSDSAKWPRLTLTDNVDQDADGLPDTWEILYGLDPTDDGSLDPDQGPSGDPDFDGLINSDELTAGTNPSVDDTDGDGLLDDEEVNTYSTDPLDFDTDDDYLSDGDEVLIHGSDPLLIDTDSDGVNDATEVSCGSDPGNAGDVPANLLPQMIGVDFFDYANNPTNSSIFQLNGGEFFDIDNSVNNDSYVGHTCDISDWYDTGFNAGDLVNQGMVTSGDKLGLRSFNGLNTGGQDIGVFSIYPGTGSTSSNVYFKVKMIEDGTVSYAGVSFYDGDAERLFFGKTGGTGFWGLDGADLGGVAVTETFGPTNNVEYTVVGKINILGGDVTMWVDPVIASGEGSATPIASAILSAGGTYNAIRLASGGTGSVRWDELVVAYTWDGLDFAGTDSDADSLRDTWELVWTNDLAVLFTGNDADSDGLNDEAEVDLLTDPTSSDSDEDGLDDGVEVSTYSTDPAVADTDGDGLTDGEEVNTYSTDPLDADSDDDLYDDGVEVDAGTDPNNPTDNPGAAGTIIVNGSKDPLYGAPVAIQTIETGFGDNFSELNAAYAFSTNGTLCLMLTGNLENNGNTLEIFIDSGAGVTSNVLDAVGGDNVNNMDGLTFDTGFEPDYHIWFNEDDVTPGLQMNMYISDLVTSNTSVYTDIFGGSFEGFALTGTGDANAVPISVGFDNSNTAGVGGTTGAAADTNAAVAVTTGMELCIALSDIGDPPTGTIKVAAFINNGDHNYLANQTLGGLPVGTGNLGGDGAGNFTGDASGIDFSAFIGDQFFLADVFAGVAVGPYSISDIQLINGNTEVQLIFNGLTIGVDYTIQDSVDLTAGFADVPGSQFTATDATSQAVVLPADTSAEPERFFQGAVGP